MSQTIILGIEASAKVAGAALYVDDRIAAEEKVNGMLTHSETLLPMIERVYRSAGIDPKETSAIALSAGPGSFTGLRIGAATAKGLAAGWKAPLIPVSTLEALAWNACVTQALIVPMMDARRSQVYTAVYRNRDGAGPEEVIAAQACSAADLILQLKQTLCAQGLTETEASEQPLFLCGDGAALYYETVRNAFPKAVLAPAHLRFGSGGAVASLGALFYAQGKTVPGEQLEIDYLRKPQAEREREERQQAMKTAGESEK